MARQKDLFSWIKKDDSDQYKWIKKHLTKYGHPIIEPSIIYPRDQLIELIAARVPEQLIIKIRSLWNKKKSVDKKTGVQLSCHIGKRYKSKLNAIKTKNKLKDQGSAVELIISEREKDKKEIELLRKKADPESLKWSNAFECGRLNNKLKKQIERNKNLSRRLNRHTSALNKLKSEYEKLSEEIAAYRALYEDTPKEQDQMTRKEQIEFTKILIEQHRILAYIENPETEEKNYEQQ